VTRFRSVILDVDSTVAGIEGVDWLAERRGAAVAAEVARLTDRAMNGEIALEQVYGARLAAVSPTKDDVAALGAAYQAAVAPGAGSALATLRANGVELALVSGGLRAAIIPLAEALGFPATAVHAVDVTFAADGSYAWYDSTSPLTRSDGKQEIAASLGLSQPVLAVGDGSTDLAMRPAVEAFAAFTGFVRREAVVLHADYELATFQELVTLVIA
jgi:HAD superfamily phosphoserine phosphatase-like hydrolase